MKRIICMFLIYSMIFVLVGCGASTEKSEETRRDEQYYEIAHNFSRARIRKDKKTLKKYIPKIIDNKDGKEKYINMAMDIDKYNIKKIGIEYVEYTLMNIGERKEVLNVLEKEYGIDEEYVKDIKDVGYLNYDIKYINYSGKEGRIKEKNIAYKYQNKYFILLYKESEKGE